MLKETSPTSKKPVLSIITVVYNNVRDIERTVLSVLQQTYPYIEYIVVDGASTDGTLDILKKYQDQIHQLISEPDKGIYDAMNKGLSRANGTHVLFMNSGDTLYQPTTVADVFACHPDADIYYGETELFDDRWESLGLRRHAIPAHFDWKSFKYGMNICHQAIYIRKALTGPYDLSYPLSADVDWVIRAAKKAKTCVNTQLLVAKYLVGGLSKQKHRQSLFERYKIFEKHYGWLPNIWNHLIIALRLLRYKWRNGRIHD
jgi:glycosyltransferase involved in cell wall biosynthesis